MSYGILIWGQPPDIDTLFIIQKRAIRAIYNLGPQMSLREKCKEINILTVASQYIYECLEYMQKNITELAKNSDRLEFDTRFKNKLAIPRFRLQKVNASFRGQNTRRNYQSSSK